MVGVMEGQVTRVTQGAQHVSAITARPAFVGNARYGESRAQYRKVALIGQVAVKVRGPVRAGDLIVPSGVSLVVGAAWQSSQEEGLKRINTAVGLHTTLLRAQQAEIERLRRRLVAPEGSV